MSLWTDRTVKELLARVSELERRMDEKYEPRPAIGFHNPAGDEVAMLTARYTEKFGKKPHHWMKPESIAEALK